MGSIFTEEKIKLLSENKAFTSVDISAPEGITVYCRNAEVTLEETVTGGIASFRNIPYGRWTIGATLSDGITYERNVIVDDKEIPTLYFDTPSPDFYEASLESIVMACQCGKVPDTWYAGDETSINIGGTDWSIVIIGKNADTFAQTGAVAPLTLQFNLIYQRGKFNRSTDEPERWDDSYLRNTLLPSILARFPDVLKASIAPVKLRTIIGPGKYIETEDYLFLPSREDLEVTGIYEHYSDAASRIKYEASGTSYKYWLRSTWIQTSRENALDIISASGSFSYGTETSANGISPAFCIGPTYKVWEEKEEEAGGIDLSGYVTNEAFEKAISGIADAIREKTDVFCGLYARESSYRVVIPISDIKFIPKKFWLICPKPNAIIGTYDYVNSIYWSQTEGIYYATYRYDCRSLDPFKVTVEISEESITIETSGFYYNSNEYMFVAFKDEGYTNI